MKVTAFTKYGRTAASTRQRLLQYLPALQAAGISVDYHPLLQDDYVRSLASGGGFSRAAIGRSYLRRIKALTSRTDSDLIWVYGELFPYLPAAFERLAFRSGTPVVYDFDDAFFHQYADHPRPLVRKALGRKLEPLLRGAAACCCGNAYLQDYARRFCDTTIILPTVVDATVYVPAPSQTQVGPVTIGWIGSPTTWQFVQPLLAQLEEFTTSGRAAVRIVGAGANAAKKRMPGVEFVEWSEAREVEEVRKMDIGIMPLPVDDFLGAWALGKSGYKLIQYMGCGLPVVASPVGVNSEIVEPGVNGFLARTADEWRAALLALINNAELRRRLGAAGRCKVEQHYSLQVQAPRMIELFQTAAARQGSAAKPA